MRNVRQVRREFEGHDTKEEVINCFRRNEDFFFRPKGMPRVPEMLNMPSNSKKISYEILLYIFVYVSIILFSRYIYIKNEHKK